VKLRPATGDQPLVFSGCVLRDCRPTPSRWRRVGRHRDGPADL